MRWKDRSKAKWERYFNERKRLEKWHTWFAWYPVKVGVCSYGNEETVWVWLEYIERKYFFNHVLYRSKE